MVLSLSIFSLFLSILSFPFTFLLSHTHTVSILSLSSLYYTHSIYFPSNTHSLHFSFTLYYYYLSIFLSLSHSLFHSVSLSHSHSLCFFYSLSFTHSLPLSFTHSLSHPLFLLCRSYKPSGVLVGFPSTIGVGMEYFLFKTNFDDQCRNIKGQVILVGRTVKIVGGGSADCQVDNLFHFGRAGHLEFVFLLTHSFLTAKQLFPGFYTFFYAIL